MDKRLKNIHKRRDHSQTIAEVVKNSKSTKKSSTIRLNQALLKKNNQPRKVNKI